MKAKGRKVLSALLILCIIALTACNSGTGETTSDSGSDNDGEGAKGRFIEEELSLPEDITNANDAYAYGIKQTEDGSLYLLTSAGIYKSTDSGDSWTQEYQDVSVFQDKEKYMVISIAMNSSGEIILTYMEQTEMETADYPGYHYLFIDKNGQEAVVEFTLPEVSSGSGSSSVTTIIGGGSGGEEKVTESGAESDDEASVTSGEYSQEEYLSAHANALIEVRLADNGDLLGTGFSGNAIFQIDPLTGEVKHTYEVGDDDYVMSFTVTENHLIYQGIENSVVYDLTSYELVEEGNTLSQMITENSADTGSFSYSYGSSDIQLISEQDNSVYYFVNSEGLFRYAMGGTSTEQIINGSLNSMSNPEYSFNGLVKVDDETFLVLTENSQLLRYTYSETADAVPSKELKVYALTDNQNVRQAISTFQKNNPDIYVTLEIGMTGEDAVTTSDAIRTLNTNIMAGDGPDVMILDGLPIASYIEKGLLEDVSDIIKEVSDSEGLYEQIVNAYENDGKVYALPTRFTIPVAMSDKETLNNITNLGKLTETVAKLREDNPDFANIINNEGAQILAGQLLTAYLSDLQNEDGTINEVLLKEFLIGAASIYQNDIAGKDESTISGLGEAYETEEGECVSTAGAFSGPLEVFYSQPKIGLTQVNSITEYMALLGTNKAKGEWSYSLLSGEERRVFIPSTTAGINSKTELMEESKSFLRALLSQEVQKNNLSESFPVNKAAFTAMAGEQEPGTEYGSMGLSISSVDDEGNEVMGDPVMLDLIWPSEEEVAQLESLIETLDTPALTDQTIKETVIAETARCMKNEVSVDEAVTNIMQQINIYLSE